MSFIRDKIHLVASLEAEHQIRKEDKGIDFLNLI